MRDGFSECDGFVYTINQDVLLSWYKHISYLDGRGLEPPGAWTGHI